MIGFDSTCHSYLNTPAISSINQPLVQMGLMASEMLFSRIKDPSCGFTPAVFDAELILREST